MDLSRRYLLAAGPGVAAGLALASTAEAASGLDPSSERDQSDKLQAAIDKAAAPALLEAAPQFLAQHRPALWLCGLAATLSMIERVLQSEERSRLATTVAETPMGAQPPRRGTASALRWDYLRRLAGR